MKVPCEEYGTRLQYILSTCNTTHQRLSTLQATGTCVPGVFPLFFPPNTMARAPVLQEVGVVGPELYRLIRKAASEEKVLLPKNLILRRGT